MKKIIRGIFLFVLVLVFVLPLNINALTKQTLDVSIKNTQNLEIGDLTFTNISFKDYSSTSTKAFGLTGIVSNSSSNTISYTSTVYYYDLNHNLIAKGYNSNMAISGNNNFNLMSNLNILKEYSNIDISLNNILVPYNEYEITTFESLYKNAINTKDYSLLFKTKLFNESITDSKCLVGKELKDTCFKVVKEPNHSNLLASALVL